MKLTMMDQDRAGFGKRECYKCWCVSWHERCQKAGFARSPLAHTSITFTFRANLNFFLLEPMPKAKRNLKQALKAQQGRLAKKQHEQVAQAAQESKTVLVKKTKKQKLKQKHVAIKATIPYHPTDRVLLVGEGE